MPNQYKNLTIYELNILFLESKYKHVSFSTYGSYQDKAKIINEYLGDYLVRDVNFKTILMFNDYLTNTKIWKYKKHASKKTIENIMNYLSTILKKAVLLEIICENPISINHCNSNQYADILSVKQKYNLFLKSESIKASNALGDVLNFKANGGI